MGKKESKSFRLEPEYAAILQKLSVQCGDETTALRYILRNFNYDEFVRMQMKFHQAQFEYWKRIRQELETYKTEVMINAR